MTDTDIVQLVKDRNPIELVIADDFPTDGHGRYRTTRAHDSLVIDIHNQAYHWNSEDEHGDVINWVMNQSKVDFKQAVEILCKRAGLPEPVWNEATHQARMITRAREDLYEVAARVMTRWLHKNPDALAYAMGRGWNDETIAAARLGYSGPGGARTDLRDELMAEIMKAGGDIDSPPAVGLLGWRGNVETWGTDHQVEVHEDWVKNGHIPALIGRDMLIYPHMKAGKVVYFSGRGIKEKTHYNLPSALAGPRLMYVNWCWSAKAVECVITEGQADAISFGQWGIPAVALAGVSAGDELISMLDDQHHYIALDQDKAGETGAEHVARILGPMTRLITMGDAKDGNDLLQSYKAGEVDAPEQVRLVRELMRKAKTWVERLADRAGEMEGAERDEAQRQAFEVVRRMEEVERSTYRTKLAKGMGMGVRDFDHILRKMDTPADGSNPEGEPEFTFGGFIDGYLVEYLYDPTSERSSLAWRDPQGGIQSGESVMINGRRYVAEPPNNTVKRQALPFPTRVGDSKSIRELIIYIEAYIKRVMILPGTRMSRLMAYYVLLTWVYDMFETVMYLRALGSPGSGKSEMMRRIGLICYRTLAANGAGSTSSLFRAVERYRCTVFIDEADIQGSDTENDMIKFYNLGAMRGNPIWRTEKVVIDGRETFEEIGFQTFCPKLVAMRKEFRDDAVGSRSLTLKLQPRETTELISAGIPLTITDEMRDQAQALQNLLLRWRLKTWQPSKEVNPAFYDLNISARLNQVAGPLLALAEEDPEQQEEIRRELREYYSESILSLSMGLTARVIESLWKIMKYPDLRKEMVKVEPDGSLSIKIGDITRISNELMDEMNETGEEEAEEEGKGLRKKKDALLKPHRVGRILREDLQLQVSQRRQEGFSVFWNEPRMVGLSVRYGVNPDEFGPKKVEGETLMDRVEEITQPPLGGSQDD